MTASGLPRSGASPNWVARPDRVGPATLASPTRARRTRATVPLPEHYATGRLIYLETDPVEREIEVYHEQEETLAFLEPHCAFFTWGLNYGNPDCQVPLSERFPFKPVPPAVVCDLWEASGNGTAEVFTTRKLCRITSPRCTLPKSTAQPSGNMATVRPILSLSSERSSAMAAMLPVRARSVIPAAIRRWLMDLPLWDRNGYGVVSTA